MWEPNEEQLRNIKVVAALLRDRVKEIRQERKKDRRAVVFDALIESVLPPERAPQVVADFLVFPRFHEQYLHPGEPARNSASEEVLCARLLARTWCRAHVTDYAVSMMAGRARHIIASLFNADAWEVQGRAGYSYSDGVFLSPDFPECIQFLLNSPAHLSRSAIDAFVDDCVAGRFEQVDANVASHCQASTAHGLLMDVSGLRCLVLRNLYVRGQLDGATFLAIVNQFPKWISSPTGITEADACIREFRNDVLWHLATDLTPTGAAVFAHNYHGYLGARFIAVACRFIERSEDLGTDGPDRDPEWEHIYWSVGWAILGACRLAPGDSLSEVRDILAALRKETLDKILLRCDAPDLRRPGCIEDLPVSRIVLELLGFSNCYPLFLLIVRMASSMESGQTSAAVTDSTAGVVDRDEYLRLVAEAGEDDAHRLVGHLWSRRLSDASSLADAVMLLRAASGFGREALVAKAGLGNLTAVKAMGALPKEDDQELLDRYLFIRGIAEAKHKRGSTAEAGKLSAVRVALRNLAGVTGYADPMFLCWAMEAQLSLDVPETGTSEIAGYLIEATETGEGPELSVRNKRGKQLKAVPAPVRKSEAYAAICDSVSKLREQAKRFRRDFEDIMVTAKPFPRQRLGELVRTPMAAPVVLGLVLKNDTGEFGLLHSDGQALERFDGGRAGLGGSITVAHATELLAAGVLTEWRQEIDRRSLVQPFSQVTRELYHCTDAERGGGNTSRFAGQEIHVASAADAFRSRGWIHDDHRTFLRCFALPDLTVEAHMDVRRDAYEKTGEAPSSEETGEVFFTLDKEMLKIGDVPRRVFSETMRDVDAVIAATRVTDRGES